jgi:hypothetical protein
MNPTEETPVIINPDKFVPLRHNRRGRPQMKRLPKKKAQFTPEERKLALDLIREAERNADPRYVRDAAGFWMKRAAPAGQRSYV